MGQKINPVSLRLQYTNRHFDSCWYSNSFYKNLITRDIFLQQYLNNFLKLLKLPTARYSIQHLQKKTQVYSFFCYPKSRREWRSRIFGLTKKNNFSKKTRYFLKKKPEFKKKFKKQTKLSPFYATFYQSAIYKFQKKITSFQNYKLWSELTNKSKIRNNTIICNWKSKFLLPKNFLFLNNFLKKPVNNLLKNALKSPNIFLLSEKVQNNPSFSSHNRSRIFLIEKSNKNNSTDKKRENTLHSSSEKDSAIMEKKSAFWNYLLSASSRDNGYLHFLQKLFVYKTLKSNLKLKKNSKFDDKTMWFQFIEIVKSKERNTSNGALFSDLKKLETNFLEKTNQGLILRKPVFSPLGFKYKNYLEFSLSSIYKSKIHLIPFKVKHDWQHANFLADEIVYFLEKRIAFRRLKSKILKELSKIPEIRGVRITCSGRVGGKSKKAQRAKTECIKYGQTSLQVFSSKIDFSVKTAFTSFGSVGVKVWVCYN